MKECLKCKYCYDDELDKCPVDNQLLIYTLPGSTRLDEKYTLQQSITKTSMGGLYVALQQELQRVVAIKIIKPQLISSEVARERFRREAFAVATLKHPNIVTVFDFGSNQFGLSYIAMELLEGYTLAQKLKQQQRLEVPEVIRIGLEICAGLKQAHALSIVHRNLKASNIFLKAPSENVKIIDFNIVKLKAESRITSGSLVGSIHYSAPEQYQSTEVDSRADIYSLGVVLYQAVTGRLPFNASNRIDLIKQHLNDPPTRLQQHIFDIPTQLEVVVLKALEKSPDARFQTIEEFADALKKSPKRAVRQTVGMFSPELLKNNEEKSSKTAEIDYSQTVGRKKELAFVKKTFEKVCKGQLTSIVVLGSPGVGKSRFLSLCKQELKTDFCFLSSFQKEQAVTTLWEIGGLNQWLQKLIEESPETFNQYFGSLGETIKLALKKQETSEENRLSFELLSQALANLANQKPLVILLDNLDLAGSEILDFLTYLIGTAAKEKILLILTLNIQNTVRKDSRIATWINRLANLRQLQRLHLEQLSHLEMEAYIYKLFSPNCFSEDFLQKLYLISDGNPFYLTETVKNIVAKGEIYWNKQQWNNSEIGEIGEIVLSESIKEKIEERFSLLSTLAKDTLRLAAILGKFFCFEVLKEFSNLNEEKMIQIIDESVNFQLIAEYDAQDEKSFNFDFYTFNGRTAHQYLYKSWPKEELVEQHLKAASVFRGFSKDTIWQRSQTAYHLFAAGKFEEAFCEFVTAAATSWKTGDLVAARQSLKDASLSIDQAGFATITQHINKESSKLANHLCDFLMLSVDLNTLPISIQTEEQLEQVLMLAQTIGDKTLIARAFVTCGHYQRSQGNGDSAIGYFEQALGFYAATKNLHRYNILLEQLNSLRAEIRSEKPTVEF